MISREHLLKIAFWARDLAEGEIEQARRGIVEKTFPAGAYICHRGDRLESWTGVVDGLAKMGTVSKSGKDVTFAGLRTGGWFGEGTRLRQKNELDRHPAEQSSMWLVCMGLLCIQTIAHIAEAAVCLSTDPLRSAAFTATDWAKLRHRSKFKKT